MESRITSSGKFVVGGNFNYHWDNPLHHKTMQIVNTLQSVNLTQHVIPVATLLIGSHLVECSTTYHQSMCKPKHHQGITQDVSI